MKLKMICFAALLLTLFCSLAPVAKANDGDWTPTYEVQWWWKYVYPQGRQFPIYVEDVRIGADRLMPDGRAVANALAWRLKNTGPATMGFSLTLVHTLRAADGSVRFSEVIARATPTLRPGETFVLSGNSRTDNSLRGLRHGVEVQIR